MKKYFTLFILFITFTGSSQAQAVDWKLQQRINQQIADSNWGEWFQGVYYNNTSQRWIETLLIILGCVIVGKFLYLLLSKFLKALTSKTKSKLDDILVDMLEEPIVFAIVLTGIWYAFDRLIFTEGVAKFIDHAFVITYTLNITWLIARTVDALIKNYLVPLAEKSSSSLDDQMLPIVRKGLRAVIWIMGVIMGLNNAGFDVAALIAGLGIGGLALALAAQDTVKNIFGGIMIFLDKPFKIGDRIKINGYDGTITEIGIRSTRLVTLEGRKVTMPNHVFAENPVENITAEPSRKVVSVLGLTYDTTDASIQSAIDILKEIAALNDNLEKDVVAAFTGFGDFSLNITYVYYIKAGLDYFQIQNEMNLEILKRFNEAKLDFAFPTQTIIHKPA